MKMHRSGIHISVAVGLTTAAVLFACGGSSPKAASPDPAARDEAVTRLADAADVLAQIVGDGGEHAIPARISEKTRCVGVVPDLVHGALVVGAKYGRGVVTCRTEGGWSSPGFFTVKGGTVGFELGVQSLDLVILAMSERGRGGFASNEIRLGGEVVATAGPEGRGRSEETDASLRSAFVTYSHSRGLFAGVDLSGAVMHEDAEAMRAFYGHDERIAEALKSTAVVPSPADRFLSQVRSVF